MNPPDKDFFLLNKGLAPMEVILPHNQQLAYNEEYVVQFDVTYGKSYNKTIIRRIEAGIRGSQGYVYLYGIGLARIIWAHLSEHNEKRYLMIYLTNEEKTALESPSGEN